MKIYLGLGTTDLFYYFDEQYVDEGLRTMSKSLSSYIHCCYNSDKDFVDWCKYTTMFYVCMECNTILFKIRTTTFDYR